MLPQNLYFNVAGLKISGSRKAVTEQNRWNVAVRFGFCWMLPIDHFATWTYQTYVEAVEAAAAHNFKNNWQRSGWRGQASFCLPEPPFSTWLFNTFFARTGQIDLVEIMEPRERRTRSDPDQQLGFHTISCIQSSRPSRAKLIIFIFPLVDF